MSRTLRLWFLLSAAVSIASAALFCWLRYGLQASDEFAAYNHPAQPLALAVHIASSIGLTFVLGALFHAHVLAQWAKGRQARRSGLVLLSLAAVMTASGALLPSAAGLRTHTLIWAAHWISGGAFSLVLPCHILWAKRGV